MPVKKKPRLCIVALGRMGGQTGLRVVRTVRYAEEAPLDIAEAHERRLRRRALLHGAGAAVVALALATALGFVVGLAMLPPGALR